MTREGFFSRGTDVFLTPGSNTEGLTWSLSISQKGEWHNSVWERKHKSNSRIPMQQPKVLQEREGRAGFHCEVLQWTAFRHCEIQNYVLCLIKLI